MSPAARQGWRLRRLAAMSPPEIALRAFRGLRNSARRPRAPRPQEAFLSLDAALTGGASALDDAVETLEQGRFGLLPGGRDRDALERLLARSGEEPAAAADSVLGGALPAFGWTAIEADDPPDWLRDPVSGYSWPLSYWADVDYRANGGLGDPRWVWEVNRHHHLVTLARAYVATGRAEYARAVWRHVRGWIEANPPLFGINWSSPLEVGIRLISWAEAVDLIGAAGAGEGDVRRLLLSVALQAAHVSDNLSLYASSRNNHLIGEAAGILTAGAKFPFLQGAADWVRKGSARLEREFGLQIAADGVPLEQAFHYGVFALEFWLAARAAGRLLGAPPPDRPDRIEALTDFLAEVGGPTGVPPSIGDEDGGRVQALSDRGGERQAPRAVAAAAIVAGRPLPPSVAEQDLGPAAWLAGAQAVEAALCAARTDRRRGAFPEGGYFIPASGRDLGVIDCGPLGYLSIAAHGHADCLSLTLMRDGRWVVVDPGTYCYHREPVWRTHFRSTSAHSTVVVDGLDQSEMAGPFMWGRRASARQRFWAETPFFRAFEGEHDGFVGRAGVTHRRTVVLGAEGYWIVIDRLSGSGRHEVASRFQLATGFARTSEDDWVFESGSVGLAFRPVLPDGLRVRSHAGDERPIEGWVSPGFGRREAAPALVVEGTVALPAVLIVAIEPFDGRPSLDFGLEADGGRGAAVTVRGPWGSDRILAGRFERGTGELFSGGLGFEAVRGASTTRMGLEVTDWSLAGSDASREDVPNLLPRRSSRRERGGP